MDENNMFVHDVLLYIDIEYGMNKAPHLLSKGGYSNAEFQNFAYSSWAAETAKEIIIKYKNSSINVIINELEKLAKTYDNMACECRILNPNLEYNLMFSYAYDAIMNIIDFCLCYIELDSKRKIRKDHMNFIRSML